MEHNLPLRIKYKHDDGVAVLTKRSRAEKVLYAFIFAVFAVYALTIIYSLFYLFVNSFQDRLTYIDNLSAGKPFALPKTLRFSNYKDAIVGMAMVDWYGNKVYLPEMFFNSIWYCAINIAGTVLMSTFTGYVLAKYRFRGRGIIYTFAIFSMTIPVVGNAGAMYKLVADMGIYDTPIFVIVTSLSGFGVNFLMMYGFFNSISWSYAEAVFIDGGGHFTVFFKIMLPLAFMPMLTIAIISFIGCWNDYMTVLLYLPDYPTVAAGLQRSNFLREGNMPAYFAGLVLSVVPVIVVFSCCSDTIMKNFTMGGLKG